MSLFRGVTHPAFQSKDQQQVFIMEIFKMLQMINRGTNIEEILQGIFDNFTEMLPYDRIGFAKINESSYEAEAVWSQTRYDNLELTQGYKASLKNSSLESIIQTGKARILNDLGKYLKEHPHSQSTQLLYGEGIRSSLTCPIIHGDNPVGFLFFSSRAKDVYKDHHIEAFSWITEPLALALERAQMYENLVRLNKEKNMLLGMASHDLRSPIAQIQTMGELLKGDITDEDRKDLGGLLTDRCDHLLGLLNDLLDVSAIDAGRLTLNVHPTEIKTLIHQNVQYLLPIANSKRIGINVDIKEPFSLRIDPRRFSQAIDNLLTNAIKYSPTDTTIYICAQATQSRWLISVADEGVGIPAKEIPKLFNEFSKAQTSPTAGEKQFGLGLAIVKRIVEAHGGSIHVESSPGEGSTFIIAMPRTED